jgi:hypothetical protein
MEAAKETTIASLPHAVLARVFAHLPVDTRLRAAEVCRGWRTVLAEERSLWTTLDLSRSSGVAHAVTDALLRTAAARAGGAMETLDVSGCQRLAYDAVLEAVTVNGGNLLELRAAGTLSYADRTCEKVTALLRAAPRLRLLVADVVDCNADDAARMLRNEDVFQPLRIRELVVNGEGADGAALHALAAALAAHASPLKHFGMDEAQLGVADVQDALVDAALTNRVVGMKFGGCALSPVSAPSLARLLSGKALTSLNITEEIGALLDAPAAALLGGALRTNTVLQRLDLIDLRLWDDLSAAMVLLSSLVAHPSLRKLSLEFNEVAPAHAACAGAALFALVAANAPALHTLNVSDCSLGDAGLRPLMEALPRNSHLRALYASDNRMSEEFAREELLPAVRANTSLMALHSGSDYVGPYAGAVEAEAIVARRAAEAR